jgi:hypothetical protein
MHVTGTATALHAAGLLLLQGLWLACAECNSLQDSGGVRPLPIPQHTLLLHRQQQEGILLR